MAETRPTTTQIRFQSENTGEHILDDYIEECEKGGRNLADLLADIFDDNGFISQGLVEFRVTSSGDLQWRSGEFVDAGTGWQDTNADIFRHRGVWADATVYNLTDVVESGGAIWVCKTAHTSSVSFDSSKFYQLSPSVNSVPNPANPDDDGKVLQASGGSYAWGALITAYAQTILDDVDAAAARATLAALGNIVEDVTPQLGGNLDVNGKTITSVSNGDVNIVPHGTGVVNLQDKTLKRPKIVDYSETVNVIGSIGGGTQDINLEMGNVVTATVDTSATTFTFSNPAASGLACSFTLILTNGGSQTITWPASVKWANDVTPVLTASGVDILTFMTVDGGVTWYGFLAGTDMS